MPVGSVGAVLRATLSVRSTGATARNTAGADVRGAEARAAFAVRRARAGVFDTATAVNTGAGGAGPAAPAAAIIATHFARAVRRAATAVKTCIACWTTNTAAACAGLTLAGIAGANTGAAYAGLTLAGIAADTAARLSSWAARAIDAGLARRTADSAAGLKAWAAPIINTHVTGTTTAANTATGVAARDALDAGHARVVTDP